MRLGCDTSTNGLGLAPTLAVARNSQTIIIANLPRYAVHGRGSTQGSRKGSGSGGGAAQKYPTCAALPRGIAA